jgi:hypothetical protein
MKRAVIFVLTIFLFSCSPDLYDQVRRTNDPPLVVKPRVECYTRENFLAVVWDYDDAADEYLLYRDVSPTGMFNTLSYSGRALRFEEIGLNPGMPYYYKLAKRREETIFAKSACTLGVSDIIRRDQYEPNDTRETATQFIDVLDANIYYYQDAFGNSLTDVDWYCIDLEPRRYVVLKVWFPTGSNIGPNQLYFSEEGGAMLVIDNNFISNGTNLYNYEYVSVRRYFRITPYASNFISGTANGGKIGNYQVKYISSQNVN